MWEDVQTETRGHRAPWGQKDQGKLPRGDELELTGTERSTGQAGPGVQAETGWVLGRIQWLEGACADASQEE